MKILIVDDDPQILRALRITLNARGYELATAPDGERAIAAAVDRPPDLFIIDLGLPGLDGMQVIEAIRGWSEAPILVISGRTGSTDKVEALDAGADDYMTKPFVIDELLARIRALGRRIAPDPAVPVTVLGDATIDLASHTVTREVDGRTRPVRLTPTEWRVLEVLVRNPGALVTRETLLREIWGSEHVSDSGYLRLYVSQLRHKLEPVPSEPRYILTEAGMGYRLMGEADPSCGR
jgi:two-component system KDP operon response regulator KdpE